MEKNDFFLWILGLTCCLERSYPNEIFSIFSSNNVVILCFQVKFLVLLELLQHEVDIYIYFSKLFQHYFLRVHTFFFGQKYHFYSKANFNSFISLLSDFLFCSVVVFTQELIVYCFNYRSFIEYFDIEEVKFHFIILTFISLYLVYLRITFQI